MIVGAQGTYGERVEQSLKGIKRLRQYVDRMVVIIDKTVNEKQKEQLKKAGAEVYFHEWKDSMVNMRNQYLQKLQVGDWVVVFDPDEVFGEEFCKDLGEIIVDAEDKGYGLLLISSHDTTYRVNGEKNEHVSGFMKNLIYKKTKETKYIGVGNVKEVHENLSLDPNTKISRLPPKYFYEHIKQENEIWERAARNVFMAGGGNNVGDLNPYWKPLRQICMGLSLEDWTQTREYLRKGDIDARLKNWIIQNRFEGRDFEHEMMEFFIWYKWMHPKELEDFEPVRNLKEAKNEEISEFVVKIFKEVLKTEPNEPDVSEIVKGIISGEVEPNKLRELFAGYKKHVSDQPQVKKGESVRMPVPVDVDVHVTEDLFVKALLKSRTFWSKIKPKIDLGRFLENQVWDLAGFHKWFYGNQEKLGIDDLIGYLGKHGSNTIALCIMGHQKVVNMIIESVKICQPHVEEIHVQGDDFDEHTIRNLESFGCQVHIEPWNENFSDYKNKAISHATTHWVLICDHDEIPTLGLAKKLREIVEASDKGLKFNIVQFECTDMTIGEDKQTTEIPSGPRKALLHVNIKDPYYGNPHIWLKPDYYGWKQVLYKLQYNHIKAEGEELQRAVRNVFLGGGGDNWREKNDLWVELKAISNELNLFTWKRFHEYLKKGKIVEELKDLFERMFKKPWHDDELRSFSDYYYKLHPKEKKQ